MFFSSFGSLLDIIVKGVCIYILLILFLRLFGKRSLSKFNAFDFIVTVAIGSVTASTLTSSSVTLTDGFVSLLVILFLQYLVSEFAVEVPFINKLIKSEPALLYHDGEFLTKAMEKERVQKTEVEQAARESGVSDMSKVQQVILETNGNLSVIKK